MSCDDSHCWLAPFTPGDRHVISIELDGPVELGMLRLWNYNKSRVHSSRGARLVEICLDGVTIFRGEVARAPGTTEDAPFFAESILVRGRAWRPVSLGCFGVTCGSMGLSAVAAQ